MLTRGALVAVLLMLIGPAGAGALPPREADTPAPVEVPPAPVEYGFMATKQGLDGCPTRLIEIEEDGTYVYEADCPRSTTTEIPPSNVGLSPMAGTDWNKTATIVANRIDNKLAQKEAQEAHCKTAGPAAGMTYAQVLQAAHAMTDAIVRAKADLKTVRVKIDGIRAEILYRPPSGRPTGAVDRPSRVTGRAAAMLVC